MKYEYRLLLLLTTVAILAAGVALLIVGRGVAGRILLVSGGVGVALSLAVRHGGASRVTDPKEWPDSPDDPRWVELGKGEEYTGPIPDKGEAPTVEGRTLHTLEEVERQSTEGVGQCEANPMSPELSRLLRDAKGVRFTPETKERFRAAREAASRAPKHSHEEAADALLKAADRLRNATPGDFSPELRKKIDDNVARSKGKPTYTTEEVRAAPPNPRVADALAAAAHDHDISGPRRSFDELRAERDPQKPTDPVARSENTG